MQRVEGVVQHYRWGDASFLPGLLGRSPDGRPWAELWLGTHPAGPATLADGRPLDEVTGPLPYLLKVLSAARPLSLQTHPDARQAELGHRSGRYPDPHPKPELLCALTPFDALCGIRPTDDTVELLHELGLEALADRLTTDGTVRVIADLLRRELDARPIVETCRSLDRTEAELVAELDAWYPGDPAAVVALLLNRVRLAPGEALCLPPGNLHAYLHGSGIELMGASDNVVRAGLTDKVVDVDDLLAILDPTPLVRPIAPMSRRYELPGGVATLARIEPGEVHRSVGHVLAIDLGGRAWYLAPGDTLRAEHPTYVAVPG